MSLLPGSGRHKGPGQAWVAVQHLIPAPTKNPRLIPGTINNTRREGVFYVVPWRQQADAIWTPARRAGVQQAMDVPCRSARRDWRLASRPRQKNVPCLLCTTGHHRRPAAGARGMLGKTRRQRPVQARQGHRKLMPGTKKTPSRCELQGGLERSLAAAYFPT